MPGSSRGRCAACGVLLSPTTCSPRWGLTSRCFGEARPSLWGQSVTGVLGFCGEETAPGLKTLPGLQETPVRGKQELEGGGAQDSLSLVPKRDTKM